MDDQESGAGQVKPICHSHSSLAAKRTGQVSHLYSTLDSVMASLFIERFYVLMSKILISNKAQYIFLFLIGYGPYDIKLT